MTIVNNFYGSKAMLMVSGRDSAYANTATSEYGIMHDPDDPSSFTFHKMEMEDLELSFYSSPIAELEDEIIAVHTTDKKVYQWDKEKSKFKDTTETVTKIDHGLKKKSNANAGSHISDGLMAKRKDELFGRLSSHLLAKFLA